MARSACGGPGVSSIGAANPYSRGRGEHRGEAQHDAVSFVLTADARHAGRVGSWSGCDGEAGKHVFLPAPARAGGRRQAGGSRVVKTPGWGVQPGKENRRADMQTLFAAFVAEFPNQASRRGWRRRSAPEPEQVTHGQRRVSPGRPAISVVGSVVPTSLAPGTAPLRRTAYWTLGLDADWTG